MNQTYLILQHAESRPSKWQGSTSVSQAAAGGAFRFDDQEQDLLSV